MNSDWSYSSNPFLFRLLPAETKAEKLNKVTQVKWNDSSRIRAAEEFLRQSERINWDAYLEEYPDVKESGMDPVRHFVCYGIYEGRRLPNWHGVQHPSHMIRPKISIIAINRNAGSWLRKFLSCMLAQTLKDVELILVDDASDDNSAELINAISAKDERIRPIFLKDNLGKHRARKVGLEQASGEYTMFIDTSCFLIPIACETAISKLAGDYDILSFEILQTRKEHTQSPVWVSLCDYKNVFGQYEGDSIMKSALEGRLSWSIHGKIFRTSLCKDAFGEIGNVDISPLEDVYESLAIFCRANALLVIPDVLANCNAMLLQTCPQEHSDAINGARFAIGGLNHMERYCEKRGLDKVFKLIKEQVFALITPKLLHTVTPGTAKETFECLVSNFGALYVTIGLANLYFEQWTFVASKLSLLYPIAYKKHIKNIAIFYFRLTHGGVEKVISNICTVFINAGYTVRLILEERTNHGIGLDERVHVHYVSSSLPYTITNVASHLSDLNKIISYYRIDLVLYEWVNGRAFLWDILLTRLLGVSLIGALHSELAFAMGVPRGVYSAEAQIDVMKCASKITCLSKMSETVLRTFGVDALYLPNGSEISDLDTTPTWTRPKIAFVGRLDSPQKRILHALRILSEARKSLPDLSMICIGGFDNAKEEVAFYEVVEREGLLDNVQVTGWTDIVGEFLDQCHIVICTSWWESFHLGILEAQARGLPCVTYDLPIPQKEENPSIICVPRDDWRSLAREVVRLLGDKKRYQDLSREARRSAERFTNENFANNMLALVQNLHLNSPVRYDTNHDYRDWLKWAAYYAGKQEPANSYPA